MVREKSLKFLKDRSCVTLVRMGRQVKIFFPSMNWVGDDNDF